MSVFDEANERLMPLVDRPKVVRCVFPDHDDTKPSATLYPNGFYCHACGGSMSPLAYVSHVEQISIADLLDKLGFPKGRPPGESSYFRSRPNALAVQDILDTADPENLAKFAGEWGLAKMLAHYPLTGEATNIELLVTDPVFLGFCRDKGFDALSIFDTAMAIRSTEGDAAPYLDGEPCTGEECRCVSH